MYCRRNFAKILNFGAPMPTHLSSIMAKFGMQDWNHGVLFIAKLRLDQSILSPLLGKNHSNIAIFTKFWNLGAPVLLSTIRTIFDVPDSALFHAKLHLHQCVSSPLRGTKKCWNTVILIKPLGLWYARLHRSSPNLACKSVYAVYLGMPHLALVGIHCRPWWRARVFPWRMLPCQISSLLFCSLAFEGRKPQHLTVFLTWTWVHS